MLVGLLPGAILLFPDDDFPVIGAGREYIAIHGVGPGHLPHGTLMAAGERARGCSDGQRKAGHSAGCSDGQKEGRALCRLFRWVKEGRALCQLFRWAKGRQGALPAGQMGKRKAGRSAGHYFGQK